ncbi:MAG: aminotransferase class I/II-fold pyridoxal phosphate-dependent enzyme [Bacilli bacterium]
MQAIILAAGMGKRLKGLTSDKTKCMVEVNGITLIERVIRQLEKFNLSKIVIVTGYEAQKLVEFVNSLESTIPIEYVDNPDYSTTNNIYSLFLAKNFLVKEDTLLLESDLIFEDDVLATLINDPNENLALVAKYESWMDGTVVTLNKDDFIIDFLGKDQFDFDDVDSYYKTVNIYKFSKEFSKSNYVPFLDAYCKALGHNEYYEQVLKVISIVNNPIIKAKRLNTQKWYEIDDAQDLDIASSLFKEPIEDKLVALTQRYGGYWRYPQMIDFCYLVNPYFPPEKMYAELSANLKRLVTDYPSSQKVQSILAANYFEIEEKQIAVGNGAAELIKSLLGYLKGNYGVIRPTFEEYPNRLDKDRIVTYTVDNPNFSYNGDSIISFFDGKNINNLVLINPDNPSGNYLGKEDVLKLLDWTKSKNIKLILDESFIDFADNGFEESLLDQTIIEDNPHLIVIKSISKSYGVPGFRLGVLCSSDLVLVDYIKKDIAIWNINSFGEFFLQIAHKYKSSYIKAIKDFKKSKASFIDNLKELEFLRVIPTQANYVMCEVLEPFSAKQISSYLLDKHNILIRDLTDKNGIRGQYLRIAVKKDEENTLLISALKQLK